MADLSKYFSSRARFRVLETLCAQSEGMPLRQISSLVNLPVRSVEIALKALLAQGVVTSERDKRYVQFKLRDKNPDVTLLRSLFCFLKNKELSERANSMQKRAGAALRFNSDALQMICKARETK